MSYTRSWVFELPLKRQNLEDFDQWKLQLLELWVSLFFSD